MAVIYYPIWDANGGHPPPTQAIEGRYHLTCAGKSIPGLTGFERHWEGFELGGEGVKNIDLYYLPPEENGGGWRDATIVIDFDVIHGSPFPWVAFTLGILALTGLILLGWNLIRIERVIKTPVGAFLVVFGSLIAAGVLVATRRRWVRAFTSGD